MKGAVLLEDGSRYEGELFGALRPTSGEIGQYRYDVNCGDIA